jgi:hypothetical protein
MAGASEERLVSHDRLRHGGGSYLRESFASQQHPGPYDVMVGYRLRSAAYGGRVYGDNNQFNWPTAFSLANIHAYRVIFLHIRTHSNKDT